MFIFNLHIPICGKKASSQALTLHRIWKQGGRASNETNLAPPSKGRFRNVTSGNL